MNANMRHDGSPFDLAVNQVLDDLSRNPSQFVDMLQGECVLDYYHVPKGDALDALVYHQNPERYESSRKLGEALHACYLAYIAGKVQTLEEKAIGKALHFFADRFAVDQAETDE